MTEMRKDRRAPASLKVKYKSATVDEFIEQFGTDVSRGGIFIKTKKPLEAGALLKFEFQLHDGSPVLHGVGRVAWRRLEQPGRPDLPAGMGIKFFKLSDQSRVVVERIESRNAGATSRYEQSDAAEFAPPLSGQPLAGDSGAKPLPGNGRRGAGGSGPQTMPPPPAASSIPPALADVPPRAAGPSGRAGARPGAGPLSRPAGGPLPKGMAGSFFPDKVGVGSRNPSAPASRTRETSDFLATAFQAGGAGPEVRDRARAQAERASRDPESVELARELFGDLGESAEAAPGNSATGGTLLGVAAPSGESPLPEAAIGTPVPAVELPRGAGTRSSRPSLADRIPSIEQLVEDAGAARTPAAARDSLRGAAPEAEAGRGASVPLTLAISVPHSGAAAADGAVEPPGRSRVLLFAALATTLTLGAVAVYIGMQRGAFGPAVEQAAVPGGGEAKSAHSAASDVAPPAAQDPQPTAAAQPGQPAPEPGPEVPVAVQSKPRGAQVSIAGVDRGETPLVVPLPSNVPVEIRVSRSGFGTLTRTVTPSDGAPAEMFELVPLDYQLVVTTEPPGATVKALGREVQSPAPLELGQPTGPVTVTAELPGYRRAVHTLKLDEFREGEGSMRAEITLTLSPLPAARRRAAREAPTQPSEAPPPAPRDMPPPAPSEADAPVVQVKPQAEAEPSEPATAAPPAPAAPPSPAAPPAPAAPPPTAAEPPAPETH